MSWRTASCPRRGTATCANPFSLSFRLNRVMFGAGGFGHFLTDAKYSSAPLPARCSRTSRRITFYAAIGVTPADGVLLDGTGDTGQIFTVDPT